MHAWLIDIYRSKNRLILWLKTPDEDIKIEQEFIPTIYVEDNAQVRCLLRSNNILFEPCVKKDCVYEKKNVLSVKIACDQFERFISWFEKRTEHRVPIYNADLKPELQFLYEKDLRPFCTLDVETLKAIDFEPSVPLNTIYIAITPSHASCKDDVPVAKIMIEHDGMTKEFKGDERDMLNEFTERFSTINPDILVVEQGFIRVPYLVTRLQQHGIVCPLHRWDPTPLQYRGGRTYFTFGQVRYQNYAVRLNGRLLVDTASTFGHSEIDGLVELCQISGARLQQIASRSAGAVFQMTLLRVLNSEGLLIPYKQLPNNPSMTATEMLKADRAGHTMDPKVGFHRNVAEIDFTSMFPWLMYNRNISAEQLLSDKPPFEYAPGLPIRISVERKGFVPRAILPFLERRMYYKQHPSAPNKAKAEALKGVLVSSNGYLRFREFKLGMARTHMALCAYARETMMMAKELAEEQGFEIVHGIVDALYLRRPGMTEEDVKAFCDELGMLTGIPVSFEGIFHWIVFLTSVNDPHRPVPARYFGVYRSGSIKARGIEVRQRASPRIVRMFQQQCLERLAPLRTKQELIDAAPELGRSLREVLQRIPQLHANWLTCRVCIGREKYTHNVPQREIMEQLRARGISISAGQSVKLVHTVHGPVLPEEYKGNANKEFYERLLLRSLYILLQPLGFSLSDVRELAGEERQKKMKEFIRTRT